MTRRTLLATAAAALGVPVVAKEVAPVVPEIWSIFGRPVTNWRVTVRAVDGCHFSMASWSPDRKAFEVARAKIERMYPRAAGNVHSELVSVTGYSYL